MSARAGSGQPAAAAPPAAPWWRDAVIYQVYPRSFADGNGDGIGDLHGLLAHLNHLEWLGVDALWLSPIFRSPMADFGYDISEYCDIDPLFGDLDTFDRVVAGCHDRGIKVLLDWVPNHTSDQHPWFLDSRSSRTSARRDWYVWRDPSPDGGRPNNWLAAFPAGEPAWEWDEVTGQYYLRCFLREQPDLSWDHPQVRAAMADTLRFWLDRGVDGFRMDVVHLLGKDLTRDDPADIVAAGIPHVPFNDVPATHQRLREIRAVLDSYPGDRVSVGEVYLLDEDAMATYYGAGDELHLSFNFMFLWAPWEAVELRRRIDRALAALAPRAAWPTWVFSNHDCPRHRTRFGGSDAAARAAAVLLLTLPGTPFLYQGEELGLLDAEIPPERAVDPGGRDGCRAPLPWTPAPDHGWPAAPWLPFPPEASTRSVSVQRATPGSMARHYRDLLALRRRSDALRQGELAWLGEANDGVLRYTRRTKADEVHVAVSTAAQPRRSGLPPGEVLASTDPGLVGGPVPDELAPHAAIVARCA
jgi:alpha-glucosidase